MTPSIRGTKYLGLRLFWGRLKSETFGFLIEKEVNKMQGWKKNLLSQAGREILMKSVVQAIPAYAWPALFFPRNSVNDLTPTSATSGGEVIQWTEVFIGPTGLIWLWQYQRVEWGSETSTHSISPY
ncbi:unnamed protein product [Camellia sinensis]